MTTEQKLEAARNEEPYTLGTEQRILRILRVLKSDNKAGNNRAKSAKRGVAS